MQLLQGYRFWEWFTNNHERYLEIHLLDDAEIAVLADELNKHLNKYCAQLEIEIRPEGRAVKEFIVSARGLSNILNRRKTWCCWRLA